MATWTKKAKCPNCLPDVAGAYFEAHGSNEWKCQNCGHTTPRRTNNPSQKITPSVEKIIEKLKQLGWKLETKFIGRRIVWVVGQKDRGHPNLNLFIGDMFYGSVGPRGAFKFKLNRIGGDVDITDDIGIEVYLK